MGRRKSSKNKRKPTNPSDYGIFAVRMPENQIRRFKAMAKTIQTKRNKTKKSDEPFLYVGDVVIEALEFGLSRLRDSKI